MTRSNARARIPSAAPTDQLSIAATGASFSVSSDLCVQMSGPRAALL
jgi:hypothetical protein